MIALPAFASSGDRSQQNLLGEDLTQKTVRRASPPTKIVFDLHQGRNDLLLACSMVLTRGVIPRS